MEINLRGRKHECYWARQERERERERENKCKIFYQNFKCKIFGRSLRLVIQCTRRIAIVTHVQKWTRVIIGTAPVHWSTRHKPHPKYFTQICLGWFGWLKIFYFWPNILLQNKYCKMWKYFPKNILHWNKWRVNNLIYQGLKDLHVQSLINKVI